MFLESEKEENFQEMWLGALWETVEGESRENPSVKDSDHPSRELGNWINHRIL